MHSLSGTAIQTIKSQILTEDFLTSVDEKDETLKKSVYDAGVIVDIFRGREGLHNALVLLGLAREGPISNTDLSRKLGLEQSVTYRRLKDLEERFSVKSRLVANEDRKKRNLFWITRKGWRECAFLVKDDRLLENSEVYDVSRDRIITKKELEEDRNSSEDPIPLRVQLQIEYILHQSAEIYSRTKWGREWLKVKKRLEEQIGPQEVMNWISRYPGLEEVRETAFFVKTRSLHL